VVDYRHHDLLNFLQEPSSRQHHQSADFSPFLVSTLDKLKSEPKLTIEEVVMPFQHLWDGAVKVEFSLLSGGCRASKKSISSG
jgi:hypothetical protein